MSKEAWFFYEDDDHGFAFIACSFEEAKEMAGHGELEQNCSDEQAFEISGVEIDDMPLGQVDCWLGLKRCIYGWIEDVCPICGIDYKKLHVSEEFPGLIMCLDCEEYLYEVAMEKQSSHDHCT